MEWIGLAVQLLLLLIAVYLYLFALGAIKIKHPGRAAKAEAFRKENGRVVRILALALMAIMFFNVVLSMGALF